MPANFILRLDSVDSGSCEATSRALRTYLDYFAAAQPEAFA